MSYSTSKLLTVAECDQATAIATERKGDLMFEQTATIRELSGKEKSTALSQASLASVKAEITGTEAAIAALPDGDAKMDLQSKLRRLNDRKENLEERLSKGGTLGMLNTELDAELMQVQVDEIDNYLEAIGIRKGEL